MCAPQPAQDTRYPHFRRAEAGPALPSAGRLAPSVELWWLRNSASSAHSGPACVQFWPWSAVPHHERYLVICTYINITSTAVNRFIFKNDTKIHLHLTPSNICSCSRKYSLQTSIYTWIPFGYFGQINDNTFMVKLMQEKHLHLSTFILSGAQRFIFLFSLD